jgi:hypothetical protein
MGVDGWTSGGLLHFAGECEKYSKPARGTRPGTEGTRPNPEGTRKGMPLLYTKTLAQPGERENSSKAHQEKGACDTPFKQECHAPAKSFMVARRGSHESVGSSMNGPHPHPRATIKAHPTPHHPLSPLRISPEWAVPPSTGDHKGPPNPTSSTVAPTDVFSSYAFLSELRMVLMVVPQTVH